MDRYKETFQTWDKIASLYEQVFMDLELYNNSYDLFCELIGTESPSILELGCGPGNVSKYIISKFPKCKFLGTDISPNMIALAKKNNPTAQFGVLDCREIDSIQYKFNAIIGGFCLPYLSTTDCQKLMADSNRLLTKDGILYLSFVEGPAENSGYQSNAGRRTYFYYHEWNTFEAQLINNGFNLEHRLKIKYPIKKDTYQIHTVVTAKKIGI